MKMKAKRYRNLEIGPLGPLRPLVPSPGERRPGPRRARLHLQPSPLGYPHRWGEGSGTADLRPHGARPCDAFPHPRRSRLPTLLPVARLLQRGEADPDGRRDSGRSLDDLLPFVLGEGDERLALSGLVLGRHGGGRYFRLSGTVHLVLPPLVLDHRESLRRVQGNSTARTSASAARALTHAGVQLLPLEPGQPRACPPRLGSSARRARADEASAALSAATDAAWRFTASLLGWPTASGAGAWGRSPP